MHGVCRIWDIICSLYPGTCSQLPLLELGSYSSSCVSFIVSYTGTNCVVFVILLMFIPCPCKKPYRNKSGVVSPGNSDSISYF